MVTYAPIACKHKVSGSISLPSRGSFHLSLTVLFAIGHLVVFSLRRWSSLIPTGFHVPCGTLDSRLAPNNFAYRTVTSFRPAFQLCSAIVRMSIMRVRTPSYVSVIRFRLFPFRSPLLRKSLLYFLFLRVLRCFSSPSSLHYAMYSRNDTHITTGRFPHSDIYGSKLICSSP